MIYSLIGLLLAFIPMIVWSNWDDGIRAPKEFYSILGFIMIIAVTIANYHLKPFKNKFLLAFWVWCFLTTIFNSYLMPVFLPQAVLQMPSSLFAWKEMFYVSLVIFTVYCISSFVPNPPKKFIIGNLVIDCSDLSFKQSFRIMCNIVSFIIIAMGIYCVIQAIGLDQWFRTCDYSTGWIADHPLSGHVNSVGHISRRVVGTLGNPSILAMWIAICLPMCLYLRSRLGYVAYLMGLGVIGITISATAILGAVLSTFAYFFFNYKKTLLVILILLIPFAYMQSAKIWDKAEHLLNPTGRIEVHKEMFKILENRAITGMGLGTFEYIIGYNPEIVSKLNNQNWRELHDEYGQIWFSTGLIGLTLIAGFIITIMMGFLKNVNFESITLFCSMLVFLIMSFSYFTMRVSPISFYGTIFLGLLLRQGENE